MDLVELVEEGCVFFHFCVDTELFKLVGGLEHFLFSPIVGMMIQSDYIIFFKGVETTNL